MAIKPQLHLHLHFTVLAPSTTCCLAACIQVLLLPFNSILVSSLIRNVSDHRLPISPVISFLIEPFSIIFICQQSRAINVCFSKSSSHLLPPRVPIRAHVVSLFLPTLVHVHRVVLKLNPYHNHEVSLCFNEMTFPKVLAKELFLTPFC